MADDSASSKTKTEAKWNGKKDARDLPGALTYNNYTSTRTRSGHTLTLDDSKGAESITVQHRSGSMFQCLPDGSMQFVSHNGQYTVVFGENRMLITGAHDVTVRGDCSLSVDGDYNMTVQGNHNTVVTGDMNITAKNMNTVVRGNMDTSAKNMTTKIEGSTEITTEGVTNIVSDGGLSLSSTTESVSILGQGDVGIGAEGKIMIDAGGTMDMKSGGAMRQQSGGAMSMKAGGNIGMDGSSDIWLNSGKSVDAEDMAVSIPPPKNPNAGGPR